MGAYLPLLVSQRMAQAMRIRASLPTRLVKLYSNYHSRLAEAINRKDHAAIDQLAARNFKLRSAHNIATPIPRTDRISQLLTKPATSVSIGGMDVHNYGSIRFISFVMKRDAANHNLSSAAIIDVWMKSGNKSILKVRYAAFQAPSSQLVPGGVREPHINSDTKAGFDSIESKQISRWRVSQVDPWRRAKCDGCLPTIDRLGDTEP